MNRHLAVGLAFLALGLLPPRGADAALAYRRQITLLGAQVSVTGAPHLNFPVLVSITDPTLRLAANGGHITSPSAYDIAFRDNAFALLDWEVEKYDGVTGTLVAWVRIPSLAAGGGVNTIIYLDYGDCTVGTQTNTPANVWTAGFRYVYHLSEPSGNPIDSTANAIVATRNPNGDATTVETMNVPGRIGGAIDMTAPPTVPPAAYTVGPPATDTHVSVADGNYAAGTAFTLEAWVRFRTVPAAGQLVGVVTKGRESGTNWLGIDRAGTGVASEIWPAPANNLNGTTVLNAGTWYYVAATYNSAGSPNRRRIFVNGVQENSDNVNPAFTTALNTRLGDDSNGNWLDGQLDEVRYSLGTARSAGWLLTSFNNQNSPGTFYTLGAESSIGVANTCGVMLVDSGTYAGNGVDNRPIFVGFQPDVVFVKADAATYQVARTSTMVGDATKSLSLAGLALFPNGVQSLDPTGFTVGTDATVNANATTYYWVAFKAAAGQLKVGTYTGNGIDNTSITGVGFQPVYVITLPTVGGVNGVPVNRSSSMIGDTSYNFDATEIGPPANAIQALQTDGFQVGNAGFVNTNLATYHYIAWNAVPGRVAVGSYVGNGVDNRNLDVTGFEPEWVLVKRTGDQRPWNDKPASTGVNTNYSLTSSNFAGQSDDIQQLRPLGFQVGFGPEAFPDRTNDAGVTYHWIAFGPHQGQTNYRSIGTAPAYGTGTITTTTASPDVTGAGTTWVTSNRGRGDVLTTPCPDPPVCTGGVNYQVLATMSNTGLRLATPYAGASGAGKSYLLRRQFTTLTAWESCIDYSVACPFFPVASSSLVNDDRSEVEIAYKDSVFFEQLDINGSTTDAAHTITLTADPGNRHFGIPGSGVVIDAAGATNGNGIGVYDNYVTVEWMEIRNGGASTDGMDFRVVSGPSHRVARFNLIHDLGGEGIQIHAPCSDVLAYDNIIYKSDRGIRVDDPLDPTADTVQLFNNTVYATLSASLAGISSVAPVSGTPILLRNNIVHSSASGIDYDVRGLDPSSSNNLAGDTTGTTHSPGGGGVNSVALAAMKFVNTTAGSENLHILPGSAAQDVAVTLGSAFNVDIDAGPRVVPWDVGADDINATTVVQLLSFTARAVPGGVIELAWETASELTNLGFHVYRGLSPDGPWTRLDASLIPGLGSSAVGRAYSFRDAGLVAGTRYFYRLEDVDASTKTTSHGPVSAVALSASAGPADKTSPGADTKPKAAASCPDWVRVAYGAIADPDAAGGAVGCTRHGDPEAVALDVLARDSRSATLELRTGGFYALHEPAGSVRVFVPGFDFPPHAEAAALPLRRALVEAVVGRSVRLGSVRALDLASYPGLVPSALGEAEMRVGRDGTLRAARHDARGSQHALPPGDLARLLPSVFQGERKSAVVEIAPFRLDARRQIVLARRVRLRLLFTGRETGESGRGSEGRSRGKPPLPAPDGELLARLYTTSRGLYSASFEQLLPGRSGNLAVSELRLERQGVPIALHVEPASARFGPGSVLFFHADQSAASTDFSAEIAYELRRGSGGLQMPLVSATPAGAALESASARTAEFEVNRFYQPGLLDAPDLWLWDAVASGGTRSEAFSLSGVDTFTNGAAQLEVRLQGASESGNPVDHHIGVSVNGTPVGEDEFAGKQPFRMRLAVPVSLLRNGANELSLTSFADTGVPSVVFLDRFSLTYPQLPVLSGGAFEGTWSETGTTTLAGSAGPVSVLDVTATTDGLVPAPGQAGPGWLVGYPSSAASVRFQAQAGRRYIVTSHALAPRVAAPGRSTLRDAANQADYVLIAPRAFLAAAEPLVERRRDQGLAAQAISFEEIADQFGGGRPSAESIKAFLAYAYHTWARPSLRYVLLLGDSSYDPRNFTGTSLPSPLPVLWTKTSYLWTASDPELAAVNGDDALPDLAIGRLPATTVEQAETLVSKLIAWEDSGQGLQGQAALVADNPDLGGDFEQNVRDIAESYLASRNPQLLLLSELGPEMRPRIGDALNGGLSYLSYVGHGGAAVWASENVWNSWDAASLQAQSLQPLLVTLDCLNGYFVAPSYDSLAESLIKVEGRGAIAAFSPSGLSLDGPAHQYHRALMAELTSGQHQRLGDALLAAQTAYAKTGLMPELLSVYHLFGDPAMRIH